MKIEINVFDWSIEDFQMETPELATMSRGETCNIRACRYSGRRLDQITQDLLGGVEPAHPVHTSAGVGIAGTQV
jgi:hypothetical protein